MATGFLFICAFVQGYWLYRLFKKSDEYDARITALETRKPEPFKQKEPERVPRQIFEKPIEAPKAGTVAANAIKPKVFLSQTPHQAVALDNGGLEWEPKI